MRLLATTTQTCRGGRGAGQEGVGEPRGVTWELTEWLASNACRFMQRARSRGNVDTGGVRDGWGAGEADRGGTATTPCPADPDGSRPGETAGQHRKNTASAKKKRIDRTP